MVRRALPALALGAALWAAPASAQDDRDPGFLAGLIEDNISAPGLDVQIDGFRGALSSEASVEELRISDDEGTWLVMRDVVLDWNRSALLRGRLEVEELTAGLIRVERAPLPAEGVEPPPAAAGGFRLPTLPVSVDVERLAAERIELGQALLGQEIALDLEASARLADGSGEASIEANRLDGAEGVYSIRAAYDGAGEAGALSLDVDLREAQGGLVTTLAQLPGAPPIELTVTGAGPLDAFAADIRLASDGQERLGGRVALEGAEDGRRFDVDLSGDVTELFAPRYKPFFGDDVALVAQGVQGADGTIALDALELDTQALTLTGAARIGADGWPELLDLRGAVRSQDGGPVLLPTAANVTLGAAFLTLTYDAAQGEDVDLILSVSDLIHPDVTVAAADLTVDGLIAREGGTVRAASAAVAAALDGLAFARPDLADAVGPRVALETDVTWEAGAPVTLDDLRLSGPGYGLQGRVAIAPGAEETAGLELDLALEAALDELGRLSGLAGTDLSGAAEVAVNGTVDPLAGTFDVTVEGLARDVAAGIEQADGLLAGRTVLFVDARRSVEGTVVDALRLTNDQLSLEASATIYGEESESRAAGVTGAAVLELRIADGTVIDPRLDGEIALVAELDQGDDGAWSGELDALAPAGVAVSASGTLTGERPDLTFSAVVPDLSAYVPDVPDGAALTGRAFARDGVWTVDTELAGPWGLTGSVEGPVNGGAAEVTFDLVLPDLSGPVPAVADIPALDGEVALRGTASQDGATWSVDVDANVATGVTARIDGTVTGEAPSVAYAIEVPALEEVVPALEGIEPLNGRAALEGTASQADGAWSVDAALTTDGGIRATASGPVTGPAPRVAFTAEVPRLEAVVPALAQVPPLTGAVSLTGVATQAEGVWAVAAEAATAGGVRAELSGPVTGETPEIAFALTAPQLQAFAPALEGLDFLDGPVAVDGVLANRAEAWRVDATLDAPSGISARARGPLTGPDALTLDVAATVDDVAVFQPVVSGPLSVDATLTPTEAGFAVEARAAGPLDSRATLSTVIADPLVADFTLTLPSLVGVAPVEGGIDVAGQARQTEDGTVIDVAGTGPYDASFEATVALAEAIAVTASGRLPDAGRIAPQLRGPVDFQADVAQVDGQWAVDVDLDGAQGISLQAQGVATGPAADLSFSLALPDVSPFAPGLSGPLRASGDLRRAGAGYAFDVDASGPLGAVLDAQGTFGAGAPTADFTLSVPDIAPLVPELPGPLRVSGRATQAPGGVALDVDATGPGGTTARVSGTVGSSLDLDVAGQAPLGLANAFISPNRITGTATFDLSVDGAPGLDAVSGTISTRGAALVVPSPGVVIEAIDADVRLAGGRAQVALTARPDAGGVIQVGGSVGLTAPFDAALTVGFDGRLEDPSLYTARVIAQVAVTGPLTGGASIAGDVLIDEAEIAVPSSGLTAIGELPPIRHVGAPADVRRTLARAGQEPSGASGGGGSGGAGGPVYGLDITVRAPNRIFVRGRGLDAELGGELFVNGTTANPVVSGGFELQRGRLDILQQRFQLDEGSVTFQGDLTPFVRLVAITEAEALTASIIVEGPADAIDVRFESNPDVPQEEILAQIFFGRDLSQLSPLQALQLANSVATLAGRGNGGLLENLRGSAGLDDLDLTTDAEGNTAIRAGKYISDNVYTDVQLGEGGARVTLNLDLTENLTVRGAAGASGETSIGIFFEKDY